MSTYVQFDKTTGLIHATIMGAPNAPVIEDPAVGQLVVERAVDHEAEMVDLTTNTLVPRPPRA